MSLKQRVVYGAIVGFLVMAFLVLPVTAATMVSVGNVYYQGGDHSGYPLNIAISMINTCRDECLKYDWCKYVTYTDAHTVINPGDYGNCWLKDSTAQGPNPYPSGSSGTSWVKQDTGGSSCQAPSTSCNNKCVDLTTDPNNCGTCGNSCGTGQTCVNRVCSVQQPVVSIGYLNIYITPPGANIYIDGSYQGSGGFSEQYPIGLHTVRLTLTGYPDYYTTVNILPNQPSTISYTFTQSQSPTTTVSLQVSTTTGSLQISSTPSGATIYIDGTNQGTTTATISGLSAGSHTVKLTKNGYVDYSTTSSVIGGQITPVDVQLVQSQGESTSTTGDLSITSQPAGASINLDGWDKGITPQTLPNVKVGTHTLTLKLAGYTDWSNSIVIIGGQTNPVSVTLIQNPQGGGVGGYGSIAIQSNPSNANVYLDGQSSGTTPLTIPNVNTGTHTILLTLQGYSDLSRTVDVAAGSQNQISVDLQRSSKVPGFEAILAVFSIMGLVLYRMLRRREE